jgi:hypothetical protein
MLVGSGEMIAARNHRLKQTLPKRVRGYRLYTNVQARHAAAQTRCPVYVQGCRATEVLFGKAGFRFERRLTGFRRTRNIVRIRTKCPGGE